MVIVGKTVKHKTFGTGTIISIDDGRFTISFDNAGTKELGINLSIANGLITMEGLELPKEQIDLLRDESKIRNAESYAEKALAPYMEYLD